MSNDPFQTQRIQAGPMSSPINNPFSSASHDTARGMVGQAEKMVESLARSHAHLLSAIKMARMTVFAVARDRTVTMWTKVPDTSDSASHIGENERKNVNTVLRQLIPTSNIQPFLEPLESVMNGECTGTTLDCNTGTSFSP